MCRGPRHDREHRKPQVWRRTGLPVGAGGGVRAMRPRVRIFWALFAVTLAVYAAMVLWTLPQIAAEAAGQRPFDLRPLGYSADEARKFLDALSASGRQVYLGAQAMLDLAFPPLMAATAGLAFALLLPPRRRRVRAVLIALASVPMVLDWLENWRVREMLEAPGAVGDAMIAAASRATMLKSAAYTLEYSALLIALAAVLVRRRRGGAR